MNLLLLLSALFSALTGVGASAPAPAAAQAVARAHAPRAVAPVARRVAARPAIALPRLAEVVATVWRATVIAVIGTPLFMDRRRE